MLKRFIRPFKRAGSLSGSEFKPFVYGYLEITCNIKTGLAPLIGIAHNESDVAPARLILSILKLLFIAIAIGNGKTHYKPRNHQKMEGSSSNKSFRS